MSHPSEKVVIFDYGSQYTQLIARRIRELGVYSQILPPETPVADLRAEPPAGLILSGGPNSLTNNTLPFDQEWLNQGIPVLGICYGMQLMNHLAGGKVHPQDKGEYGFQRIQVKTSCPLFEGLPQEQSVWMSHRDSVEVLAPSYFSIADSDDRLIAAIQHCEHPFFGLQFHPEVTHTQFGTKILENFLKLCCCQKTWSLDNYIDQVGEEIRHQVGSGRVISLVSGGVDSTVATCLCQRALGSENVHALYVDTGLMRQGETDQVRKMFHDQGFTHLTIAESGPEFLAALKGVSDPEKKRKIIGKTFIDVLNREMGKLEAQGHDTFFCQGTLYTDLIESGKGCGKNAAVIKSHHNVNIPIIEEKRRQGRIVEPNREIFKDEVRKLGTLLDLPHQMVWRHPFPGPGLGIRVLGEVTEESLRYLRQADAIYLEEIARAGLYDQIWQAFAVLIPVTTVGVMGDQRTEGHVVALRAVTSHDGMTAEVFAFPPEILARIATRVVNEVHGVNRVVYDVTSKPPGTIEWE